MKKDVNYKNAVLKAQGSKLHNDPIKYSKVDEKGVEMSELERVIYAPNPLTGFPDNDLQMQDDMQTRIELRDALAKRNYPVASDSSTVDDDDLILDGMQKNDESDVAYANRLKKFANEKKD